MKEARSEIDLTISCDAHQLSEKILNEKITLNFKEGVNLRKWLCKSLNIVLFYQEIVCQCFQDTPMALAR